MEKKFVANKALILNSDGHILLMRDSGQGDHANSKGKWDIPGGRMEAGETPGEALARELKEEVGVVVDASLARPIHVDLWGVGGDIVNSPIVGIFYLVNIGAATVQLSDEHSEYMWFDPNTAIPEGTKESVQNAIRSYLALR